MSLELGLFYVDDIQFGPRTCLQGRTLQVSQSDLRTELLSDARLADCQFAVARPGEPVRVIHVVDVVEPRLKVATGDYFPGVLGDLSQSGVGRTHVLRGMTVMVACPLPAAEEAILDMTGVAARLSKFGTTCNLVVTPVLRPEVSREDANRVALECGLAAAIHLARATLDLAPAAVETYSWAEPAPGVPRVAYIYYLNSQGYGREKFLFGKSTRDILPAIVHPNDILDGAVTNGAATAPTKAVTFNHMNNGILRSLYRHHNVDLALAGVIVVNHGASFEDKHRGAVLAAHLADQVLRCVGVVMTKDGGGQADVDMAECCDCCEGLGLKTVQLVMETGSEIGGEHPLVVVARQADAIVTTGNCTERLQLSTPVQTLIGGQTLYDGTPADAGELTLSYGQILGATDFQGDLLITCREY